MSNRGKSPGWVRTLIPIGVTVLFCIGIALFVTSVMKTRQTVYEEHDQRMGDIALFLDHGIDTVLSQCNQELSRIVESDQVRLAEAQYRSGGQTAPLAEALSRTSILAVDYATRVIVRDEGKILISTDPEDRLSYNLFSETENGNLWICVDNSDGKVYMGIVERPEGQSLTYVMLLDLEAFYDRVVLQKTYEEFWIVLYDRESGLVLQNSDTLSAFEFYSEQEIRQREDGLTVLLDYESSGKSGAADYSFTNTSGEHHDSRMYVVPTEKGENGTFAIGISVHRDTIYGSVPLSTVGAVFLISISVSAGLFYLLHSRRRERELAKELATVEKEKELTDSLLKQREELAHHQKLETIGTLTAGIAHEFNNLLSPIMGNSLLIIENASPDDPNVYDNAIDIYEASRKAKNLISRISKLSRRNSAAEMHPVSPANLLDGVLSMMASTIPKNITVEKKVSTSQNILGNEGQLEHTFINLIVNAIHAMGNNDGVLSLRVWDDGQDVVFTVSDTGPGIPEKALPNLFEPFFTTKESGKGTGLGLPIAQRTVNEHGGTITAANNVTVGAVFTVRIPILKQ